MLGAHGAPVGGDGTGGRGRLALGQGPLAGVAVPRTVGRLHALPRHRVFPGKRREEGGEVKGGRRTQESVS